MQKNVASQVIGAQMVSATDGSAFTGAVTVRVTGDGGTQALGSVGSGACTHEGNGYHTYAPATAETNYNLIAFTFTGTGAIPTTVQVYTVGSGGIPTAAAIADAVWDEATSGHTTSGTFGEQAKTDIDAILEDTAAMATTIATAIAGSRVSYVGPVATNGDLTLYQGNDYSGTNALVITVSSWTGPSVNGVAGQFIVSDREDYEAEGTVAVGLLISGADVVLAQSGTTVTATITIDAADLASLDTYPPKDRPTAYYQLRGEYSSGKWVPISDAKFTLVRKKPIA
jgi:hypothetical protein